MLQHGLFFKPTDDFFPLHCDSVLCCSEREKRIYVQEGVSPNRVRVLGIPLQTIGSNENNDSDSLGPQYELLILLTYVDSNNSKLLGDVLDFVRNNYNNVLLRFRPRSKDNDIKLLQDHLEGFIISEGFDISYDISRSKRCITFSADAIVEVVKMKKPFVYIWLKEYLEFIQDIQCATMDNYKEHIQSLLEKDNYTSKMQSFATDMIGEQDVNILRERFIDYIRA